MTSVLSDPISSSNQNVAEVIPKKGRFISRVVDRNESSSVAEISRKNPLFKNNFSDEFRRKIQARANTHLYEQYQPKILSTSIEPSKVRRTLDSSTFDQPVEKAIEFSDFQTRISSHNQRPQS